MKIRYATRRRDCRIHRNRFSFRAAGKEIFRSRGLSVCLSLAALVAVAAGMGGCLKGDDPDLYTDLYWFRNAAFDFKVDSTRTDPDTISVPVFRMRGRVFDTDTVGFVVLSDTTTARDPENYEILTPVVRFADPDTVRSEIRMIVHPQSLSAETLTVGLRLEYRYDDVPEGVRRHDRTLVRITAVDGPSRDAFWFDRSADTLHVDTTQREPVEFALPVLRLGGIRHKTDRVVVGAVADSTTALRPEMFDFVSSEAVFVTSDTLRSEVVLQIRPQAIDTVRTVGLRLSYTHPAGYEEQEDRPEFVMLYLQPVSGEGGQRPDEPEDPGTPDDSQEPGETASPSVSGESAVTGATVSAGVSPHRK